MVFLLLLFMLKLFHTDVGWFLGCCFQVPSQKFLIHWIGCYEKVLDSDVLHKFKQITDFEWFFVRLTVVRLATVVDSIPLYWFATLRNAPKSPLLPQYCESFYFSQVSIQLIATRTLLSPQTSTRLPHFAGNSSSLLSLPLFL